MDNEIIIDDSYNSDQDIQSGLCGTKPRVSAPGSLSFAPIPDLELIPRIEWRERIADLTREGALLSQVSTREGIPTKHQQTTNYCHANSPALVIEILRAVQREPFVSMSPASIAGPITGFRNEGAYIEDDLEQITKVGCASVAFVPPNQIGKSGFKAGWEQDAAKYRVTEWWDLGRKDSQMFARCMSVLLGGLPICVAYNWWSHAVTLIDPYVDAQGNFGFRFRNSWGANWPKAGANGYALLMEGKGTPDAAYVPRNVVIGRAA